MELLIEYINEALVDAIIDCAKLIPFLFLTYLIMELIEHKTGNKATAFISRAGKLGPLFGGLLGAVPQCGFSAAASGLYAGRVITVGTLLAVFLSTSDEMFMLMLSSGFGNSRNLIKLATILAIKILGGIIVGFIVDLIVRRIKPSNNSHSEIGELCEKENCHCGNSNLFVSSLLHTLRIFGFIFAVTLVINTVIFFAGEDTIGSVMRNIPVVGEMLAGLIGLIPNCAASVIITNLYLEGAITASQMLAGLFTGAGVGIVVLFRMNRNIKQNIAITAILYGSGVLLGIILGLTGVTALLGL